MPPQLATKLTLHEAEVVTDLAPRRRQAATAATDAAAAAATDSAAVLAGERGLVDSGGRVAASLAWREMLNRRLLGLADMTAVALTLLLVSNISGQRRLALTTLVGVALVIFLFKAAGLYDRDELRLVHSTLDEVPLLVQLTGLFALSVGILDAIVLGGRVGVDQVASLWATSFGAVVGGRVLARAVAGRTSPLERCLVIGELQPVQRIRDKLASSHSRARVVASLPLAGEDISSNGWVDGPETIRHVVRDLNVHRIIIAPTTTDSSGVVELIRIAKAVGVRVSVLPRMFEVVGSAVEFDDVDGMTMLGVRRFGLSRSSLALKRSFDLIAATLGMFVIGPLILAVTLAIRLDTRGPIFFRQVRVGRDGRHFDILKFRSMVADAEARKDELRALNEAGKGLFKITNDPRVTRVGRFLRHTSLDELPQLLNVLRGEMSLVGPRPLVIDEDAQVRGLDRSRLHLTPGMTGPWQIMGSRVPMQEMVGVDYLYVANWSLWLDLKVLIRTARHVARHGNV